MTVTRDTAATRQQVWDVVADGWTYSQWVVGNSRIRAVGADWPAEGSTIRHSIGVWPAVINDETVVERSRPREEIVLLAKLGPFGAARITLRLEDGGDGCRIVMHEVPVRGPMAALPAPVALAALWPRNRECTWRLAALAERRVPDDLG
jgi:hypothetical protein